ncbi:MAG: insulinase family protein [Chloroflexi bacterium]|nr:insulinase family protein [Chloroflexota bacterium]
MVLATAGAISHEEVVRIAAEWGADGPSLDGSTPARAPVAAPAPKPAPPGSIRVSHRRLAQGNLCLGMPGVARDDPDRWTHDILGAILGDGMGSRLFLELRERRSLVYDVSTFSSAYADTGTFGVHAGFDPDDAQRVIRGIVEQLDRIAGERVRSEELDRARAYARGRLELRMEESAAVAGWLGAGEAHLPRILSV